MSYVLVVLVIKAKMKNEAEGTAEDSANVRAQSMHNNSPFMKGAV